MNQRSEIDFPGEVCTWRGVSGRHYRFSVYAIDAQPLPLHGVFILARLGDLFAPYRPLLIDSCENFALELPGSPLFEAACADADGAGSLHLYYTNLTNPDRHALERDLSERYWPQLSRPSAGLAALTPIPPRGIVIPFPRAARRQSA